MSTAGQAASNDASKQAQVSLVLNVTKDAEVGVVGFIKEHFPQASAITAMHLDEAHLKARIDTPIGEVKVDIEAHVVEGPLVN